MVTLGQVLACFFLEPVSRCPVSKFTRAMCDLWNGPQVTSNKLKKQETLIADEVSFFISGLR